jgi:DNA primase
LQNSAEQMHAALPGSPASTYLEGRALGPDSAAQHRLGYAGNTGITGLEQFTNHLAIPYLSVDGHVVAIKFRNLGEGIRYGQPTGQKARLFNVSAFERADDYIVVTEGEIDAISLDSLGIPAVGVTGINSFKPHHARLFEGFARVIVFKDDDVPKPVPGRKNEDGSPVMRIASDELVATLREYELPVSVVKAPGGKDVNDALVAGLGDELVETVRSVL